MTLVTYEDITQFLETDETEEGLLNLLSFNATTELENYTHRILAQREISEFHNGHNQNTLELRQYPVQEITSIKVWRTNPIPDYIPIAKEIYNYDPNPEGPVQIRLLIHFSFPRGDRNIKVTYTAGYTRETLPDDLMMACVETVSWLYKRLKARQIGVSQLVDERNRTGRTLYDRTLPPHVREILEPYRIKGW